LKEKASSYFVYFPITEEIIGHIDEPIKTMAALLPRPERKSIASGGFYWAHPVESAEVVQVAKAVRIAAGINAAWGLAEAGFVTECYTILRSVSDFSLEIVFLAEGIMEGTLNVSQKKFIDQFFAPFPMDADEFATMARESFVRREKMIAARIRLLHQGGGADQIARKMAFVNKMLDSYVHGGYSTVMELFNGETFMIRGHESLEKHLLAKKFVSAKLYEALMALQLMARTRQLPDLVRQIRVERDRLMESGECS
jgi:hypothetical protein